MNGDFKIPTRKTLLLGLTIAVAGAILVNVLIVLLVRTLT